MKSPAITKSVFLVFFALSALPLLAQTPAPVPIRPVPPGQRIRQEPCWEEAGVSRTAMEQRRGIESSTKSQVAAVCTDSALTAQQKHEKIREIREHARQEMEALISPQQREAIRSCQESRSTGRHAGGGMHRHEGESPCGEMPSSAPSPSQSEPPSSAPQP
jgi:hypothetical protein